ncbi:MAG TPA: glycosyltransferase 87 family protein [Jatrophihabitantaceae bacterium]|jgi:alpha-1,2-mannosyltransferase
MPSPAATAHASANATTRRTKHKVRSTVLVALATAALLLIRWRAQLWTSWGLIDLDVFRRGGHALVHSQSLYANRPELPFTYPPFAALLFTPLSITGRTPAIAAITAASLLSYVVIVRVCATVLALPARTVTMCAIGCLGYEPVLRTLQLGQVNLVLVALVLLDAGRVPTRFRGTLTGLAAGVKITPSVFLLYYALRRDWAAVGRCAAAFVASMLIGAIWAPHDSRAYWSRLGGLPDRVGGRLYVDNQSIGGVLARTLHTQHPPTVLTATLSLAALALAVLAAHRRLTRHDDSLGALVCIAIGGLLVSPISWTHHWVWFVPATLVLIAHGNRATAAAVYLTCALAPCWFTPSGDLRELHDAPWQVGLSAMFAVVGVGVLIALARPSVPLSGSDRPLVSLAAR